MKLKELGFDEQCFGFYHSLNVLRLQYHLPNIAKFFTNSNIINLEKSFPLKPKESCVAPLWSQAIDFFREFLHYDIHVTFRHENDNKISGINSVYYDYEIYHLLHGGDAYKIYSFSQLKVILVEKKSLSYLINFFMNILISIIKRMINGLKKTCK